MVYNKIDHVTGLFIYSFDIPTISKITEIILIEASGFPKLFAYR